MYRLRAKVEIAERPELAWRPCSATARSRRSACRRAGSGEAVRRRRRPGRPALPELGARAILGPRRLARLARRSEPAEFAAYDRHRLALGIADGSRDLVPEKSILLESGFDELHGVDWQKGCYVGQELTARTKYRGLIKKRLFPVRIDGPTPDAGALVTLDGKEAGEMRSSRDGIGLGPAAPRCGRRGPPAVGRWCDPDPAAARLDDSASRRAQRPDPT